MCLLQNIKKQPGNEMKLTADPHLVPRLRMSGAVPPLALMPSRLNFHRRRFEVLLWHLSGGTGENDDRFYSRWPDSFGIYIFVNCIWFAFRWQQCSTHLHTNSTQNDTKHTIHRTTQKFWKSAGRAPSLRVMPYN